MPELQGFGIPIDLKDQGVGVVIKPYLAVCRLVPILA
jgi:hypothetical protein